MRFAYYQQLSRRDQAIYRQSDRIHRVPLDDPSALRPFAEALREALAGEDRRAVRRAAQRLVDGLLGQLAAPPVKVHVLAVRPSSSSSELHGEYLELDDGPARIRLWMRTAARHDVVRFRTFFRTLIHELCHHLDYTLFDLEDSFHTEGFFLRESWLTRALIGTRAPSKRSASSPAAGKSPKRPGRSRAKTADGSQLELPLDPPSEQNKKS